MFRRWRVRATKDARAARGWFREAQDLSWLLYSLPKVTIAAVNGAAVGAGLGIALACDLRIASSGAKFGTAYAKVGFGGDFGTTWLLTHYAGAPKAKELFFLAENIDAGRSAPHWSSESGGGAGCSR